MGGRRRRDEWKMDEEGVGELVGNIVFFYDLYLAAATDKLDDVDIKAGTTPAQHRWSVFQWARQLIRVLLEHFEGHLQTPLQGSEMTPTPPLAPSSQSSRAVSGDTVASASMNEQPSGSSDAPRRSSSMEEETEAQSPAVSQHSGDAGWEIDSNGYIIDDAEDAAPEEVEPFTPAQLAIYSRVTLEPEGIWREVDADQPGRPTASSSSGQEGAPHTSSTAPGTAASSPHTSLLTTAATPPTTETSTSCAPWLWGQPPSLPMETCTLTSTGVTWAVPQQMMMGTTSLETFADNVGEIFSDATTFVQLGSDAVFLVPEDEPNVDAEVRLVEMLDGEKWEVRGFNDEPSRVKFELADNKDLKFNQMESFESALNGAALQLGWLASQEQEVLVQSEEDKVMVYKRGRVRFSLSTSDPIKNVAVALGVQWTSADSSPRDRGQAFLAKLDSFPINQEAMFELQRHGFTQTRSLVPDGMFHDRFPQGAQVNRYESTVAYVYTQGSTFAFKANKLCFEENWGELFKQYGHIMRCLWMYVEKMQARYGCSQTLYRGMQGLWDDFQCEYQVGSCLEWRSFTSTSTNKNIALDFALGKYSGGNQFPKRPVLFVIQTKSRGAPLCSWSKYPDEDEVLLLPFQRFVVEDISVQHGILIIQLQTVAPPQQQRAYQVIGNRGLAYRFSRDLNDRDDEPSGPRFGNVFTGRSEGRDWVVTTIPGLGDRFLPISIDDQVKLREVPKTREISELSQIQSMTLGVVGRDDQSDTYDALPASPLEVIMRGCFFFFLLIACLREMMQR
ncbi:unnamed protein product [Symbiodinium sp. CCMP2456]|nr:unnamed protein product [Symbiodinium sp. CCMP2456]